MAETQLGKKVYRIKQLLFVQPVPCCGPPCVLKAIGGPPDIADWVAFAQICAFFIFAN